MFTHTPKKKIQNPAAKKLIDNKKIIGVTGHNICTCSRIPFPWRFDSVGHLGWPNSSCQCSSVPATWDQRAECDLMFGRADEVAIILFGAGTVLPMAVGFLLSDTAQQRMGVVFRAQRFPFNHTAMGKIEVFRSTAVTVSFWPYSCERIEVRFRSTALTLSLPWCHLKTTHKSAKFETLEHFCLLFRTGIWKDLHGNS